MSYNPVEFYTKKQLRGRPAVAASRSGESFYSNREIYEMLCQETEERGKLSQELQKTLQYMKKYNGLNEKLDLQGSRIQALEDEKISAAPRKEGQFAIGEAVKKWSAWVIGLITFGYWLAQILGG